MADTCREAHVLSSRRFGMRLKLDIETQDRRPGQIAGLEIPSSRAFITGGAVNTSSLVQSLDLSA